MKRIIYKIFILNEWQVSTENIGARGIYAHK